MRPLIFSVTAEVQRLNYSYEFICVNRRSYYKNPHKYFLRWRSVERPLRSLLEYRRKSGAIFGAKLSSNDARAAAAEDLGIGSLSSGVQALC